MADHGGQRTQCRVFRYGDPPEGVMVDEEDEAVLGKRKKRGTVDSIINQMQQMAKVRKQERKEDRLLQERVVRIQENVLNVLGDLAKAFIKQLEK